MHILTMLILTILGISIGDNVSWLLGAPVIALTFWFFSYGSDHWREHYSNHFFTAGLFCAALIAVYN